jgi:cytosine/adenosine deaminase-related metal-dependent hydrolase
MILKNLTLPDGRQADLHTENTLISFIGKNSAKPASSQKTLDCKGYLLLPALCDMHTHPDKTLLGMDWYVNDVGPRRIDRIENERKNRKRLGVNTFLQTSRLIELALAQGTLYMRGHVDIDTENGLTGLEGVLAAREKYGDVFHLEVVAFPQSGLMIRPGTVALMEKALEMGADLVGGIDPAEVDRDPKGSIDAIFALAEKSGKPVDIHVHEPEELGAFSLSLIADHTIASGMGGNVTVSHAFCLGSEKESLVKPLLERLAAAGVSLTTGGHSNSTCPKIKEVLGAGINICGGNDDIRDMWSPFGSADVLERIQFIAMKNGFRKDSDIELALRLCTENAAKMLKLECYGPEVGNPATFLLVKARNITEAVVTQPADRMIFKNGRQVFPRVDSL